MSTTLQSQIQIAVHNIDHNIIFTLCLLVVLLNQSKDLYQKNGEACYLTNCQEAREGNWK